jgi:hypothetical protein
MLWLNLWFNMNRGIPQAPQSWAMQQRQQQGAQQQFWPLARPQLPQWASSRMPMLASTSQIWPLMWTQQQDSPTVWWKPIMSMDTLQNIFNQNFTWDKSNAEEVYEFLNQYDKTNNIPGLTERLNILKESTRRGEEMNMANAWMSDSEIEELWAANFGSIQRKQSMFNENLFSNLFKTSVLGYVWYLWYKWAKSKISKFLLDRAISKWWESWRTATLPKSVQQWKGVILWDILDVPLTTSEALRMDKDSMANTFTKYFKPVKNFDELYSQSEFLLEDTPGSVINRRNALINQYNKPHRVWQLLTNAVKYLKDVWLDPQWWPRSDEYDEVARIIAKEESWLAGRRDAGKLDTKLIEKRKEQLWRQLRTFFNNTDALSPLEKVKQQALAALHKSYMDEVASIADGTPDEGMIRMMNKEYQDLINIRNVTEKQASKYKEVSSPTITNKVAKSIINKFKPVPWIYSRMVEWLRPVVWTKEQWKLDALATNIDNATKKMKPYVDKITKSQLVKGWGKTLWGIFVWLWILAAAQEWGSTWQRAMASEQITPEIRWVDDYLMVLNRTATLTQWPRQVTQPVQIPSITQQWPDAAPASATLFTTLFNSKLWLAELLFMGINWGLRQWTKEYDKIMNGISNALSKLDKNGIEVLEDELVDLYDAFVEQDVTKVNF